MHTDRTLGKILQMQGQSKCLSASTLQTQFQNMRSPSTSYLNDDGCSSFYHNTTRTLQIKTHLSMSVFCWVSYTEIRMMWMVQTFGDGEGKTRWQKWKNIYSRQDYILINDYFSFHFSGNLQSISHVTLPGRP